MKRTIQEQLEQGNITPEEMREAIEAKRRELSEMAAAMGKKGGKKNSPEKSATARENGQKGGRPAKSLPVIDRAQQKIEKNIASQGGGATLESLLAQQGMTKQNLVDEIKLQKLVTKMVGDDVTVTDKEVADYLAAQEQQAALSSVQPTELPSKDQVKEQLKQQKLQEKIQAFVADLKGKAKITYFVEY